MTLINWLCSPIDLRCVWQFLFPLFFLTDASFLDQGGTSPLPGAVELMLHRRLLDDDAFGKDLDGDNNVDDGDDGSQG